MKEKFNLINKALFVLIFLQVLSLTNVFAYEDKGNVTIKIPLSPYMQDLEGRSFEIYKIMDARPSDEQKLLSELSKKSDDDLKKTYDHFLVGPSILNESKDMGLITFELKDGTYLVKETNDGKSPKVEAFLIIMPSRDGRDFDVLPKYEYKKPKKPPEYPPDKPPNPPPKYRVELYKLSDDGNKLPGAVFKLYKVFDKSLEEVKLSGNSYDDKGETRELVTDDNGLIAIENLPEGKYIFKEIKAPKGYVIVNEDTSFEIYGNEGTRLEVVNNKNPGNFGSYKFIKVDENNNPLEGAYFKVLKVTEDGEEPLLVNGKEYVLKSDVNGNFTAENLAFGDYILWETMAPEGYIISSNKINFTVDENYFEEAKKAIINKKDKPRVKIPKTGDITQIVAIISGSILIAMGCVFIFSKEKS
ncbi:MSCRAMM family protein [Peptoniphilus raoultii]|uniref:MSCRAMM family protein n=1 Tax=Peptoniphilus raoultii TaxID=1776387 RepID=UPI0008DB3245|nr:SpaA isopeptide-forming pilin-related protein [Peptoniphilus raoultii]